ncbi:hypothetical protein GCM10018785_11630 [Streptomyces longispororuber]|uniref:Uncharacterized protein n=1 Tax=Streptomyces longispororuber TaxID=68230 RepID=A0A918ZB87_9ACTN|nr:hypothetical protein [Streptomyces longispororuber]GHE43729.1 hypothetical protein GCM10018785_11630 [Streptomyces longispororuber]
MSSRSSHSRTGLSRFLGDIVDSSKDFIDGALDRMQDTERDIRRGLTRAVEYRERSGTRGEGHREEYEYRTERRHYDDDARFDEEREVVREDTTRSKSSRPTSATSSTKSAP